MKERGEGGRKRGETAGLLPLVQADGTKSIMYKDVKRNGSEMPNGVRMNGRGGGGRRPRNRRREEQWSPRDGGRKDGGPKEGGRGRKRGSGAQRGAEKSAIREAIEEGPTPPVDSGEMNPAKEEESCVPDARPTMCKVAARVF